MSSNEGSPDQSKKCSALSDRIIRDFEALLRDCPEVVCDVYTQLSVLAIEYGCNTLVGEGGKMALVFVSMRIRDSDGDVNAMTVTFPVGSLTLTDIVTGAGNLAALVDAVTAGVIEEITIGISIDLPGGLKTTPVEDCDVQQGGLLAFSCEGTPYRASFRIPAIERAKLNGKQIDDLDVDVAALITWFVDGQVINTHGLLPSDKYENDLNSYLGGGESFRKQPRMKFSPPSA